LFFGGAAWQNQAEKNHNKQAVAQLKITLKGIFSAMNLISIFRGKPIKDEEPLELVKLGVNKVINLIIDFTLGRNRSVKGFLSTVLVEKFTTSLVNNNLINIISAISSMLRGKHVRNAETETDTDTKTETTKIINTDIENS